MCGRRVRSSGMPDTAPLSETDLVLEADLAAAGPERSVELATIFLGGLLSLQHAVEQLQSLAPGSAPPAVAVLATPLPERLLAAIRPIAGGAFTTMLVLFFVLVSGDLFLRRLVEILPGFKEKRQAVDISQQIEGDISVFLATITMMNLGVGVVTGIVMWLCGLGSPLLWGTIAFLLNFVPILG